MTLQDYSAYIVADTAWESFTFAVEAGVVRNLPSAIDLNKLIQELRIVDRNSSVSIGGAPCMSPALKLSVLCGE